MKIICINLLFLFPFILIGQLSINPNLKNEFELSKNVFPNAYKNLIEKYEKKKDSPQLALITLFKVDTLNLSEITLPDYTNISIVSINGKSYEEKVDTEYEELQHSNKTIFWTGTHMVKDTLLIYIGFPLSYESIHHKIYGNSFEVKYNESYKDEPMLKLNHDDTLNSSLNIPIKIIKFQLSTNNFMKANKIYGYCEFETIPYYFVGRDLEKGILLLKKSYKYYFESKIQP